MIIAYFHKNKIINHPLKIINQIHFNLDPIN